MGIGDRMLKNIEAVIFDMDGTLIDSMWMWKSIDEEYLGEFNIDYPDDLQSNIEGMSFTETCYYLKEEFDIPDDVDAIRNHINTMAWDYYENKVPMKNNALNFLDLLTMKKIKLGIGTSNSRELVNLVLSKLNVKHYFESIRTSCEVEKGKPHPDIYLQVAKDINVKPENCLVFEDVPNGLLAAKGAGMKCCAVYDDFSSHLWNKMVDIADYNIKDYGDILNLIKED